MLPGEVASRLPEQSWRGESVQESLIPAAASPVEVQPSYSSGPDCWTAVKKDAPTNAAELAKFQELDGKAVNLIISFSQDDLLDLIREKESAKDIWATLRKQLAKLEMAEDSSIRDHLKTFDELIRKLKSAGAKLDEGDLVSQLFVTRPQSYEPGRR